jgi:hypothetical protein
MPTRYKNFYATTFVTNKSVRSLKRKTLSAKNVPTLKEENQAK